MARRRPNQTIIGILFIVLLWLGVAYKMRKWPFAPFPSNNETTFRLYPDFGIELPQDYSIHGIDVSRYQKRVNWPLVKAMKSYDVSLQFAVIKATEGQSLKDVEFDRNWRKAKECNMVRGAYHFFRAKADAAAQARKYIKTVTLQPGDLPPVLDVESLYNQPLDEFQDKVAMWLMLIEQHYKVKPIIYTGATFYNNYLHPRFADYPLWVAHYNEKRAPRVKREWVIWQHSESGRVNGINHFVDFNVFNGDSIKFSKLLVPAL